jgi:carbamoylphosphate synthase small subunit
MIGLRDYRVAAPLRYADRPVVHCRSRPLRDCRATGRIEVTTQNHGFAVDVDSLKGKCELTHVHLNDGVCEGIRHPETGAFSVAATCCATLTDP